LGKKSRRRRSRIKQLRSAGVPLREATKLAVTEDLGVSAGFIQGAAVIPPIIAGVRGGIQAAQRFFTTPLGRQVGGGAAAGVAGGVAIELIPDGQGGMVPARKGGLKGVSMIDASTGLRLGIISRKRALALLGRKRRPVSRTKTKLLSIKDGCVQVVNT